MDNSADAVDWLLMSRNMKLTNSAILNNYFNLDDKCAQGNSITKEIIL